ncbi:MAG: hypothetical protein OEM67_01460 [Thermoleophilia bacterium]|nr:hypothetical protein [Thermoleophilia bacterium]MDH3725341.1 hypothetical protein [Thermoleophilia bacterium]
MAALGVLAVVPAVSASAGILGLPFFISFFVSVIASSVLMYGDA